MTLIQNLICTFITFISLTSFSGQSGYLLNGKEVVTHIDGKEVNSNLIDENNGPKNPTISKRNPTNVQVKGLIQYDEDSFARCYWLSNQNSLQCIKK